MLVVWGSSIISIPTLSLWIREWDGRDLTVPVSEIGFLDSFKFQAIFPKQTPSFPPGSVASSVVKGCTPPKFNMEPENHQFGKGQHIFQIIIFGFHVSFRGYKCASFLKKWRTLLVNSHWGIAKIFPMKVTFRIYLPGPSKGCQMVPKGCQFTIP